MTRWSVRRQLFPWIALGAPAAAWLLPGQSAIPLLPFLVSAVTWCLPAAFLAGWPDSGDRRALAETLKGTRAGSGSLIIPELTVPFLAGSIPALAVTAAFLGPEGVPWQVWTVIPFSALTAASATVLLERYLGIAGGFIGLAGFMAQASTASWADSGVFQLLVPQGYTLWAIRWFQDSGAALHGDIYTFFSVLSGVGLSILAYRALAGWD